MKFVSVAAPALLLVAPTNQPTNHATQPRWASAANMSKGFTAPPDTPPTPHREAFNPPPSFQVASVFVFNIQSLYTSTQVL